MKLYFSLAFAAFVSALALRNDDSPDNISGKPKQFINEYEEEASKFPQNPEWWAPGFYPDYKGNFMTFETEFLQNYTETLKKLQSSFDILLDAPRDRQISVDTFMLFLKSFHNLSIPITRIFRNFAMNYLYSMWKAVGTGLIEPTQPPGFEPLDTSPAHGFGTIEMGNPPNSGSIRLLERSFYGEHNHDIFPDLPLQSTPELSTAPWSRDNQRLNQLRQKHSRHNPWFTLPGADLDAKIAGAGLLNMIVPFMDMGSTVGNLVNADKKGIFKVFERMGKMGRDLWNVLFLLSPALKRDEPVCLDFWGGRLESNIKGLPIGLIEGKMFKGLGQGFLYGPLVIAIGIVAGQFTTSGSTLIAKSGQKWGDAIWLGEHQHLQVVANVSHHLSCEAKPHRMPYLAARSSSFEQMLTDIAVMDPTSVVMDALKFAAGLPGALYMLHNGIDNYRKFTNLSPYLTNLTYGVLFQESFNTWGQGINDALPSDEQMNITLTSLDGEASFMWYRAISYVEHMDYILSKIFNDPKFDLDLKKLRVSLEDFLTKVSGSKS